MATLRMILLSVSFLNHKIQELDYKYDAMDSLYQFTKSAKINFKQLKKQN